LDEPILYKEQSSNLLLHLNSLRHENILTDVLLCSENTEIPYHRNVLVSSSPYFRAMFCNNFIERRQTRIKLQGLTSAILNTIIDYVYTGLAHISMDNVLPLMQATSMLQYNQLSPDNCLSLIRLSELMNCNTLREKAKDMAMKRFSDVFHSEDLCELSLPELTGYLEDDRLCAEEEQVFDTLVAWIHHDPLTRCGAINALFKKVRLRHVHPTYLFQFIASDPLIQSSALCIELIESVRRLMFSVSIKYLGGLTGDFEPEGRTMSKAQEKSQEWKRLAKLPIRLYKASYAALHSVVYVIGRLNTNAKYCEVCTTVYTLSFKTNEWRLAQPILEPRFSHQSVSYLHFIFILGGLGFDRHLTDSVERYNSMFNQWESMAPMPEAVLHPAVAATNQRIYMFGGEDAMQNPVRLTNVHFRAKNNFFKIFSPPTGRRRSDRTVHSSVAQTQAPLTPTTGRRGAEKARSTVRQPNRQDAATARLRTTVRRPTVQNHNELRQGMRVSPMTRVNRKKNVKQTLKKNNSG
uniref:Kelch like family member 38 n=1 Tax=Hippocampus comes TaxID=109280 RepID=A0A3Q2ZLP6_HIPCM